MASGYTLPKILKTMKFLLTITMLIIVENTFCQTTKINDSGDFGRYGDCSTGRGVCGIGIDNLNAKSTTARFLIEKKNDSVVQMKILKVKLQLLDEVAVFGKNINDFTIREKKYFLLEEDLPLDIDVITLLLLKNKYTRITKGLFAIVEYQNYYLIELKLN